MEKNKKLLVLIEESAEHIKAVCEACGDDFHVTIACTPYKFMSSLCAERPDVVMMNPTVAWFDHGSLREAVTKCALASDTQLVVMSNEGEQRSFEEFSKHGRCSFLSKNDEFRSELTELIKRFRGL